VDAADLPSPLVPQAWERHARCVGHDGAAWFAEHNDPAVSGYAKQVCSECSVRAECLAFAVANNITVGIWGGLTATERQARTDRERRTGTDRTIS
jgi:WhiB family transcriptional regulator, redox-sensing transcriptional regulator